MVHSVVYVMISLKEISEQGDAMRRKMSLGSEDDQFLLGFKDYLWSVFQDGAQLYSSFSTNVSKFEIKYHFSRKERTYSR